MILESGRQLICTSEESMACLLLAIIHKLSNITYFSSRPRTVTRGVNRNVRVDLVGAMERQIKRCHEPIEPILREFFQHENLSVDLTN